MPRRVWLEYRQATLLEAVNRLWQQDINHPKLSELFEELFCNQQEIEA